MPGEFEFISWIRAQQVAGGIVRVPAGDDLAVLNWDASDLLLVGVDQVLDGVHFESARHAPRDIGRKVMNRNLSDCAAMACLPAGAVVTLALPRGATIDYARELYLGIREAGDQFDCPIVGGDTGTWAEKLAVMVCVFGRSAGIEPVTRGGAKPGDSIYVTGALGGSLRGRHMSFAPRIHEARWLATHCSVHAMIDISDGLSRDVGHICRQSGVGAIIDAGAIPIHEDARAIAADGRSPLERALHDGEDHELLLTIPQSSKPIALPGTSITRIGTITAEREILIDADGRRTILESKGWEHTF